MELIDAGRMQAAGFAQIGAAKNDDRWEAAYAPASRAEVPHDLQTALDGNPKAAAFFATLTSANRYTVLYRILSKHLDLIAGVRVEQAVINGALGLARLQGCVGPDR